MTTSPPPVRTLTIYGWASVRPSREPDWSDTLSPAQKRRMPRIWQLAHVALNRLVTTSPEHFPRSLQTATALGALDETVNFLEGVFSTGFGSPRHFIASVHNSMAGKLAIDHKITGPNLTFCDSHNSLAAAISGATLLSEEAFPAAILAVEEHVPLLDSLLPHFSTACRDGYDPDENDGAVVLLCGLSGKGPAVGALPPFPASAADRFRLLTEQSSRLFGNAVNREPVEETSRSYLSPALTLHRLLDHPLSEPVAIPSWSPTAQAAALIGLWP